MVDQRTIRNPYQILCVSENATREEVRIAFRKLIKRYHPDRNPNRKRWAEEQLIRLVNAYKEIQQSKKRSMDDQVLERVYAKRKSRLKPKEKTDGQIILEYLLNRKGCSAAEKYESLLKRGCKLRDQLRYGDYCDCAFLLAEHYQKGSRVRRGVELYEELYARIGVKSSKSYLIPEIEDRLKHLYVQVMPKRVEKAESLKFYMKALETLPLVNGERTLILRKVSELRRTLSKTRKKSGTS